MVEVICKTCGGHNQFESLMGEMICDYCGVQIELDDERSRFANLYSKADDAWDRKDFDEALSLYEQIVEEDNSQSEAHWGAALCRYGVAYVRDMFRDVMMPTCNRVNRTSILDDKNYLAAIKYAGPKARRSYESRAQEIDRISKQFLKIVENEKPYDVFISYKKTGFDNRLTQDSQFARKLYQYLTNQGIKVFFAEETLESVAGQMYEPYIFAALTSAKVMVLMGSRRDYFEAPWVKNEWTRYLKQMQEDPSKALIPACIHCKPEDELPMRLSMMQALDATGPAFCETVESIVKKKMKAAPQAAKAGNLNILSERYATKEKVARVVSELDCEPELAAEVLIIQQGKTDDAIRYISSSEDYRKKVWICAECKRKNTHDVCANPNCGISKAESATIKRKRDDAARQLQEQKRKEEEQRRREYERSAEAKRIRAAKRSAAVSKVVKTLVALGVLAAVVFGAISLYTGVIQPMIHDNATADSFYSPEILQTYYGTYTASAGEGKAIITFEQCSQTGEVTGIFEFVIDGQYGKYAVTGTITDRKNNGKIVMTMDPGAWILQPTNYIPLESMELEFEKDFMSFTGSRNSLRVSAGGNSEFDIATAADLQKLSNSDGVYILKNDIDLAGQNWTPIEGFTGVLIGNGYAIKNMTIDSDANDVGFFGVLGGTVKDINFENANITVSGRCEDIGILCGELTGMISGVSVSGTVNAEKSSAVGGVAGYVSTIGTYGLDDIHSSADVLGLEYVGGLFGQIYDLINNGTESFTLTLSNLTNAGSVTAVENYAGGICAYMDADATGFSGSVKTTILDCKNTGTITGVYSVGGIVGYAQSSVASTIEGCTNASVINAGAYVGCIAGSLGRFSVSDCGNEGSELNATGYFLSDGRKLACVGGLVGSGVCLKDCTNYIDISYEGGGDYVGGLMGYCTFGPSIVSESFSGVGEANYKNLRNEGNISGNSYVGGIMGGSNYFWENGCTKVTATFEKMINTGSITAQGDYAGGISGYMAGDVGGLGGGLVWFFYDCQSEGAISGNSNVGGLFGGFKNGRAEGDAYVSNEVTIDGCVFNGEINAKSNYGDLIGLDEIKR